MNEMRHERVRAPRGETSWHESAGVAIGVGRTTPPGWRALRRGMTYVRDADDVRVMVSDIALGGERRAMLVVSTPTRPASVELLVDLVDTFWGLVPTGLEVRGRRDDDDPARHQLHVVARFAWPRRARRDCA